MGARLVGGLPPTSASPSRWTRRGRSSAGGSSGARPTSSTWRGMRLANRRSPYRALLRLAGSSSATSSAWWRGRRRGRAADPLRQGVYLTVDEFKGRRPVVRGTPTIDAGPGRLRNPLAPAPVGRDRRQPRRGHATAARPGLAARSGGEHVPRARRPRRRRLEQRGVGDARASPRSSGTPLCGGPVARWFSQLDPDARGLHPRYRWSVRAVAWTSRLAGSRCRRSSTCRSTRRSRSRAGWRSASAAGEVPHLWAFPSSAVRLCRAAGRPGSTSTGARFTVTGEPVTAARLAVIRRAGADAVPDYGSADSGGSMTYGCLAPEAARRRPPLPRPERADPGRGTRRFPAGALLVSSLRPTAPFVLLNVSMGDCAVVTDRAAVAARSRGSAGRPTCTPSGASRS